MYNIRFADGSMYEVAMGGRLGYNVLLCDTYAQVDAIYHAVKKAHNLDRVNYYIDDRLTGQFTYLALTSQSLPVLTVAGDESDRLGVVVGFRELKGEERDLYILETSQEIQDEAIEEIAEITSDLFEE